MSTAYVVRTGCTEYDFRFVGPFATKALARRSPFSSLAGERSPEGESDSGAERAEGMDARSERPATGHGRPRSHARASLAVAGLRVILRRGRQKFRRSHDDLVTPQAFADPRLA